MAIWPSLLKAQPANRMPHIAVLLVIAENDPQARPRRLAIQKGLQEQGWIDGENVSVDYRWAAGSPERLRSYAAELVALKPDALITAGEGPLTALQRETRSIPIVFTQIANPVARGFVASVTRPGGNITGIAMYEYEIAAKWLELLKQLAPHVTRVAVVYGPDNRDGAEYLHRIKSAAKNFEVSVSEISSRNLDGIKRSIDAFAGAKSGLVVLTSPTIIAGRDLIIERAAQNRLPAVYPYRYFVESGGLASYGVDNVDLYRSAASYAGRILKGENAAGLPVQFATKFELVINLRTAKALGIDPPTSLLARTDEVIE